MRTSRYIDRCLIAKKHLVKALRDYLFSPLRLKANSTGHRRAPSKEKNIKRPLNNSQKTEKKVVSVCVFLAADRVSITTGMQIRC